MATAKSPSTPDPSQPPTRGARLVLRPLIAIGALLLVASVSAATTWMLAARRFEAQAAATAAISAGQSASAQQVKLDAPPAAPPVIPAPIFLALEPFTVTLRDNDDLDRLLHVGITLRVGDEPSRQRIEKYMPEVRSRLLMTLSAQSSSTLQTSAGKQALAQLLAESVARPFAPLPDGQMVSDVLFTAFVVQ